MPFESTPFHPDYAHRLRMLHEAGQSILSLSREFGHQRRTIQTWIEKIGGTVRNRSEAMYQRMANSSPEERKAIAYAANNAVRGIKRSDNELQKRALAKSRMIGHGEPELLKALLIEGLPAEAQKPCGKYNIDIAIGYIAVELTTQGNCSKTSPRARDRRKYLRYRGYCTINIAFRFDRVDCLIGNLDNVIAFIKSAYCSPSMRCQDWVVWCRSERFSRVRNDLGQLTAIKVPERFFNIVREIDHS